MIFAVLDVSLAVNLCINCSFFTFISCYNQLSVIGDVNLFIFIYLLRLLRVLETDGHVAIVAFYHRLSATNNEPNKR